MSAEMTPDESTALAWALTQKFQSVAARQARTLANYIVRNLNMLKAAPAMLHELEVVEQDLRNLANGFLTGEAQEATFNSAARVRALIAKARGQ